MNTFQETYNLSEDDYWQLYAAIDSANKRSNGAARFYCQLWAIADIKLADGMAISDVIKYIEEQVPV